MGQKGLWRGAVEEKEDFFQIGLQHINYVGVRDLLTDLFLSLGVVFRAH